MVPQKKEKGSHPNTAIEAIIPPLDKAIANKHQILLKKIGRNSKRKLSRNYQSKKLRSKNPGKHVGLNNKFIKTPKDSKKLKREEGFINYVIKKHLRLPRYLREDSIEIFIGSQKAFDKMFKDKLHETFLEITHNKIVSLETCVRSSQVNNQRFKLMSHGLASKPSSEY